MRNPENSTIPIFPEKYWNTVILENSKNIDILENFHIPIITEEILEYIQRKYWEISSKIPLEYWNSGKFQYSNFPVDILEYYKTTKFYYFNISRGIFGILNNISIFPSGNIEIFEKWNTRISSGNIGLLEYCNPGKFQYSK